jgi:sterol desaturase/sphingolipid hydroxylase (fatty acid hydroxylase superfamily)
VTPTVWNNDSFSIPDALSVQSFFLVLPFLLPIPPAVLVFCRLFDQTKGMIGHSGFEYFGNATARWPLPLVATLHHDYHHQHFTVNFANQFTIWDRLFGTLDPKYDERVRQMARRSARDEGADAS